MLVREIKRITDRKEKVVLEDGSSFVLYAGEVRSLGIRAGEDLPKETIHQVFDGILKKRSRLRCMNLLKTSDRTCGQLRERLKKDGYPEEIIGQALAYVASFHYTDDTRYAQNYIRQMSDRKSRKQIEYELLRKGVDRETVRAALLESEELNEETQEKAILSLARKRGYDPENTDRQAAAKMIRYLLSKGFALEAVRGALRFEHFD